MIVDVLALLGAICVLAGLYAVWWPLALIGLGVGLITLAYLVEAARVDHRPPPG